MDLEHTILKEEGLDLRFYFLRLFHSIWIVIVAALAGAAICAGGHLLYKQINPQEKEYKAETKYYIDFEEDSTGIGYGYYNDYTWNDIMKSDAVLLYTMSLLPDDISKETVEEAVYADIISDVRVLTIIVTASSQELADTIAKATEQSLVHFPEDIKEIAAIRVTRSDAAVEVVVDDVTANFAIFGAVAGALISLFVWMLLCCMDNSVYVPSDVEKQLGLPVLGVTYKQNCKKEDAADNQSELMTNVSFLLKDKTKIAVVTLQDTIPQILADMEGKEVSACCVSLQDMPDYDMLRAQDAVLVCATYGGKDVRLLKRVLSDLELQQCNVAGAVITDADKWFYRCYFGLRKK